MFCCLKEVLYQFYHELIARNVALRRSSLHQSLLTIKAFRAEYHSKSSVLCTVYDNRPRDFGMLSVGCLVNGEEDSPD